MNKAVFLDRDGTLNYDKGYIYKIEDFQFLPKAVEALKLLKDDFFLFIITNQSGIGRGYYTMEDAHKFNNHLLNELKQEGISIKKTYICPHAPGDNCDCRKPSHKFVADAKKEYDIDLEHSWVIGDHPWDVEMGIKAGCRTIYLLTGHGEKHSGELDKHNIRPDFIAEGLFEAASIIRKNV